MMATSTEVVNLLREVRSWHLVRERINEQRYNARQRRGRESRHEDGRMLEMGTLPNVSLALALLANILDEMERGDGGSCLALRRIRERVEAFRLT